MTKPIATFGQPYKESVRTSLLWDSSAFDPENAGVRLVNDFVFRALDGCVYSRATETRVLLVEKPFGGETFG
jgi:hypothetical protein